MGAAMGPTSIQWAITGGEEVELGRVADAPPDLAQEQAQYHEKELRVVECSDFKQSAGNRIWTFGEKVGSTLQ